MGVHGLWRLLDSFGQVTQPENWRGRRVAIDASIWMAQFRAQTKPGHDADQQILEGFLVRILKLMYYGIQPVFVFDGPATSAKSAERRRRQLRRHALAQLHLRRRAQQIVTAQVSAGALKVADLPRRADHEDSPGEEGKDANAADDVARREEEARAGDQAEGTVVKEEGMDEEEEAKGTFSNREKAGNPELERRCRRGVQRKRRLAPDRVSKKLTQLFLSDAGEYMAMRRRGEQQLFENVLRNTSSSLFMGPRQVFTADCADNTTSRSGPGDVVDVEKEENAISIDADDEEQESGTSNDSDAAVTIPSREISIHGSDSEMSGGDAEHDEDVCVCQFRNRGGSVEVCDSSGTTPREGSAAATTRHAGTFLHSCVTPPIKRTRTERSSAGEADYGEARDESASSDAEGGSSEGSGSEVGDDMDEDEESEEDEEDEGDLLAWAEEDEGAFLWHPNTQIGPPPQEQTSSLPQYQSPSQLASQTSAASSDFVPVKEVAEARLPQMAPIATTGMTTQERAADPSYLTIATATPPPAAAATGPPAVEMHFPVPKLPLPYKRASGGLPAVDRFAGNTTSRPIPFDLLNLVELLDCCGVAFVLSPAEADAQCALLAKEGLVDAVFTEDSDVVVHGAPVVLRGFFASNRHVVEYQCRDLVTCGVNKRVLVGLAYLLGCDYTEGVPGIGLVGALDALIASWPSPTGNSGGEAGPHQGSGDTAADACEAGRVCAMLRRWHRLCADPPASWLAPPEAAEELSLLQYAVLDAHRSLWGALGLPAGFPDSEVAESFFSPKVDRDMRPFTAAPPDWQRMRVFAGGHGLLASSWVAQRLELAEREWITKHAQLAANMDGRGKEGQHQRRLDDFGVRAHVSEKWAFVKQPPQQAAALARLRAVQQASAVL